MWEKSAIIKNIEKSHTPGKNEGARSQPGSICREEGCTAVTLEIKVFGNQKKTGCWKDFYFVVWFKANSVLIRVVLQSSGNKYQRKM